MRTAIVTGGGTGIGRAITEALLAQGTQVVVISRTARPIEKAAYVTADLADRAELARGADEAAGVFGEPDILINAAGLNRRPHLDDLTIDDWDVTMAVNLTAPFLLGQRFGPGMAARGFGRIVNFGSQQTIRAFGNSGAYGVAKAGVAALSRSQAEAWSSRGVCCNTIAPGYVMTPMTAGKPEWAEAMAKRSMIGRNGMVDDYRGIILFLVSEASAFVTGQTIFVDGGFSAT
jgi:NAD(P)-dependent dehydrogenase (short-subunit alcohol dehydrogenase family)